MLEAQSMHLVHILTEVLSRKKKIVTILMIVGVFLALFAAAKNCVIAIIRKMKAYIFVDFVLIRKHVD